MEVHAFSNSKPIAAQTLKIHQRREQITVFKFSVSIKEQSSMFSLM